MDYEKIAEELLKLRAQLLQVPEYQKVREFSRGEFFVLNYLLTHNGTAYPKDLSREMRVSSARVAALLNQTERKGWTVRGADVEDNRQTRITITQEGRVEIAERKAAVFELVVEMLKKIGPDDAEELLRIKRKILDK